MKKLILVLIFSSIIFAQDENDDWKFSGQIQLRSELDGRDFKHKTHPLTFASLRTRVGVEKTFLDKLNFFVQIQDSRVFGEEGNTLGAIANIDLHQGYITLKQIFDCDLDVQAGRFEVVYGTERFFGAVGWHYIGRAWDGVRFNISPSTFKLDLFALTISESVSYIANPAQFTYPFPQEETPSYSLYGFYKKSDLNDQNKLDIFSYYENNRYLTAGGSTILKMLTFGGTYQGIFDQFSSIIEVAYQVGKFQEARDINSYFVSAAEFYQTDSYKFGIGADILSGTKEGDIDKYNSFQASFGTNHKFYGYMDYFINIPSNTFGRGLNDFYLTINILPSDSKFSFSADVHHFMSNRPFETSLPNNQTIIDNLSSFGQEIDLTLRYNFIKGTTISWGGSVFIPGELMRLIFNQGYDVAFWSYVMITANI
jgi:hypothetical protein